MSKIIYIPLEHIESRYTVHMDRDITKYLKGSGKEFIRIYPDIEHPKEMKAGSFLDAEFTIRFKSEQMAEIARLYREDVIDDGDIIFFSDIWFPGIEGLAYMNYFAKKNVKIRGFLHAGSFTDTDFVRDMERWAKNFEDVIFDIADKVYVASNFIKQDVIKKRLIDPNKLVVTGLPLDTIELDKYKDKYEKEDLVVFNGRNVDEKQPWLFEQLQHRLKSTNIGFVNTLKQNYSKEEYYELLATAKVVVSYALQENFGFGVNEAVYLGCKPVLPNRLVYPEFFSKEYLYQTFDESVEKVDDFVTFYRQPENILPNFNDSIRRWFDE